MVDRFFHSRRGGKFRVLRPALPITGDDYERHCALGEGGGDGNAHFTVEVEVKHRRLGIGVLEQLESKGDGARHPDHCGSLILQHSLQGSAPKRSVNC